MRWVIHFDQHQGLAIDLTSPPWWLREKEIGGKLWRMPVKAGDNHGITMEMTYECLQSLKGVSSNPDKVRDGSKNEL